MARDERDREDILREATALVERAELSIAAYAEPVVIGFRRNSAGSIFIGADPVYQFNSSGQLRRAFSGGRLIKAERGALVALDRRRYESEVQLVRHEFSADETAQFVATLQQHVARLRNSLRGGQFTCLGQVPKDADVIARIREWLDAFPRDIEVARTSHAR
jgi:hypothetical protein